MRRRASRTRPIGRRPRLRRQLQGGGRRRPHRQRRRGGARSTAPRPAGRSMRRSPIVGFGDFQCPFSAKAESTLARARGGAPGTTCPDRVQEPPAPDARPGALAGEGHRWQRTRKGHSWEFYDRGSSRRLPRAAHAGPARSGRRSTRSPPSSGSTGRGSRATSTIRLPSPAIARDEADAESLKVRGDADVLHRAGIASTGAQPLASGFEGRRSRSRTLTRARAPSRQEETRSVTTAGKGGSGRLRRRRSAGWRADDEKPSPPTSSP